MKKALFFLLLLPAFASAQHAVQPPTRPVTEFGVSIGHAFDNAYRNLDHGGYIRSALSLLKTTGTLQYGLTLEGGTNGNNDWYLSPGIIMNHRFAPRRSFFYAGAMTGLVISDEMAGSGRLDPPPAHGYVFGFQGGYVRAIGKGVSFNAEIGVRSTQVWRTFEDVEGERVHDDAVVVYLPVTFGLRRAL